MTKIEWVARPGTTPESWNPISGCSKISEGCRNCYAERMARRLAGRFGYPEAPNHFDVTLHPDKLGEPLHWTRKPRTVFVCSMSDIGHEAIPDVFRNHIFEIMRKASQHTFLLLTKRPGALLNFAEYYPELFELSNVWLGISVENQRCANERISILLQIPAAVRFVSVEPMLGPVDLQHVKKVGDALYHCEICSGSGVDPGKPLGITKGNVCPECSGLEALSWVIAGGESGPGARPMHPDWARDIRDQCQSAGIPYFFKQWGAWKPIGTYYEDGSYVYDWQDAQPYREAGKLVCSIGPSGDVHGNDWPPDGGWHMARTGKKRAGHLLDGEEYHEWPKRGT